MQHLLPKINLPICKQMAMINL